MKEKKMTGKELIDFIQENKTEDLEVMLVDTHSFWSFGRLKAEKIEIENTSTEKHLVIS